MAIDFLCTKYIKKIPTQSFKVGFLFFLYIKITTFNDRVIKNINIFLKLLKICINMNFLIRCQTKTLKGPMLVYSTTENSLVFTQSNLKKKKKTLKQVEFIVNSL